MLNTNDTLNVNEVCIIALRALRKGFMLYWGDVGQKWHGYIEPAPSVKVDSGVFELLGKAGFIKPLYESYDEDGLDVEESEYWVITLSGVLWLEKWHKES